MNVRGVPAFGVQQPPHDPRALAREILASGHFHLQTRVPPPSAWQRFWSWFWTQVSKLFAHSQAPPPALIQAAGFVLLIISIGLVIYALVRLLVNIQPEANAAHAANVRALQPRTAARAWYDRALASAQDARYGEAAVLLFRAALAILDLRGYVHDEPSRTVNECTADLRARAPQYLEAFARIARTFTAALYADEPIDAGQWERARSAFDELFAAVTRAS